jgi:hypothetical protein
MMSLQKRFRYFKLALIWSFHDILARSAGQNEAPTSMIINVRHLTPLLINCGDRWCATKKQRPRGSSRLMMAVEVAVAAVVGAAG